MLKKLVQQPGVNREKTRYASETGWYDCDKVRFRQGAPEKIGGWSRISTTTFQGVCRALYSWVTLASRKLLAVGTHLKHYIEFNGVYYDITPLRSSVTLAANPFTTINLSTTVTVAHTAHGAITGDFVTYTGATAVGGITLSGEYQITKLTDDTYTVTAASAASSGATGGGAVVAAAYQINGGLAIATEGYGWGSGTWGMGTWGVAGSSGLSAPRRWTQANFGEDLVMGVSHGGLYYWDASAGLENNRAVALSTLPGASDVPVVANMVMVTAASRFLIAFGCNDYGGSSEDPLLIRWANQESVVDWTPAATSQAGSLPLSQGSGIISCLQTRQEVLVWTDTALYSLQYVGAPIVWGATLLASGISCYSPAGFAQAAGVVYWMGAGKFYKYDGRVSTLRCDIGNYIFGDINTSQSAQVFAGTVESFDEVWFFYCSAASTAVDRYAVYNYMDGIWYYGTMARSAWLDGELSGSPRAATTDRILLHEYGVDDNTTATTAAIEAYIESAEFDIDDGDRFGFIKRMLPDITFAGSTATTPSVTMTMTPMRNSGSGLGRSIAGNSSATVSRSTEVEIEQFTGQVYVRVRGRQMILRVASTDIGVNWKLGDIRMDIQADGRA